MAQHLPPYLQPFAGKAIDLPHVPGSVTVRLQPMSIAVNDLVDSTIGAEQYAISVQQQARARYAVFAQLDLPRALRTLVDEAGPQTALEIGELLGECERYGTAEVTDLFEVLGQYRPPRTAYEASLPAYLRTGGAWVALDGEPLPRLEAPYRPFCDDWSEMHYAVHGEIERRVDALYETGALENLDAEVAASQAWDNLCDPRDPFWSNRRDLRRTFDLVEGQCRVRLAAAAAHPLLSRSLNALTELDLPVSPHAGELLLRAEAVDHALRPANTLSTQRHMPLWAAHQCIFWAYEGNLVRLPDHSVSEPLGRQIPITWEAPTLSKGVDQQQTGPSF